MSKLRAVIPWLLVAVGCGGGSATTGPTDTTSSTTTTSSGTGGAPPSCVDPALDCEGPMSACTSPTCVDGACATANVAEGTPTANQLPGDCHREVCDGQGQAHTIVDTKDPSDDGNECTIDGCAADGSPTYTPAAAGTKCGGGAKVCGAGPKAGQCVGCVTDTDCTGGDICNSQQGTCVAPTCQDGVKDGAETDIDCGGNDCGPCPNGGGCAAASDCTSGFCQGGLCAACGADADCASTSYCQVGSGLCVADLAPGAGCAGDAQCQSGSCVDNVCCNTSCMGACMACTAAKTGQANDGVCAPVKAGTDPDDECAGAFLCNGAGACESCADGVMNGGEAGIDCGGPCAPCGSTAATAALSCLDVLQKGPGLPSGTYWIKPPGAAAAFQVHCDMVTGGGGWTALPLRFADTSLWSINNAGSACVTITSSDNMGGFAQAFTSATGTFGDTIFKLVPQISVSAVRLVAFNHSNGGSCNSMDYAVGAISTTSLEGWWFSDTNANTPLAFTFPDANCPAPYQNGGGYCSRDTNLSAALFTIDRDLTYSATAPLFQMVIRQGCQSSLCSPAGNGERFVVSVPPDGDGIWRKGIFIR